MHNVLITGAHGQVGSELKDLEDEFNKLGYKCFFTDKETLDITNFNQVKEFVKKYQIKAVINTAAYTAVDKAEEEKELAELINYKAVENIAKACKEHNITLFHISTDYVFNGKNYKPYIEEDEADPINFYGLSKLKGEEAIKKIAPKAVIIRTSWVYSGYGKNFVQTMLKLAQTKEQLQIVADQIGSPTNAQDLAYVLLDLISHPSLKSLNGPQIYHYSNEGVCSWYDFAKAIFEIANIDIKINPIESKEYPTPAKRPYYSVLNKSKIKKDFNLDIPYWKDSLKDCLERFNNE